MFGWGKQRIPELTAHQVAVWLASHAKDEPERSTTRQVYFRAAVLLETEEEERRAFVDDVLGQ